jgi:hypothetical protein
MSDSDSELQSSVAHEELVSRPDDRGDRGDRVGGGAVLPRTTAGMTRAGLGAPAAAESSEVPRIEAEPRTLRFTAAPGEESAPASTRLTNVGSQPFQIEDLALDDGERSGFVVYGAGSDIPPGGAVEVQVAFRPHPQKTTSDRLKVIGNRGAKAVSVALRGKVVTAEKAQDARASAIVAEARQSKYPGPPKTYGEMLDALTAASELMDGPEDQRPDPFDYTHARELAEPVVRELEEVASFERVAELKRKLELNGMTQQVVDARIGNAKLAARTFMERSILGGSINGNYTLNQFRAGQEEILLLTGEKKVEGSELKQLDAASDTALKGHLAVTGAPIVAGAAAATATAAPILAAASQTAFMAAGGTSLAAARAWILANPNTALALAEAATGLALTVGEAGLEQTLSDMSTPQGIAFVLLQVAMDAMHIRGGMHADAGTLAPRPRTVPAGTSAPETEGAPTPSARALRPPSVADDAAQDEVAAVRRWAEEQATSAPPTNPADLEGERARYEARQHEVQENFQKVLAGEMAPPSGVSVDRLRLAVEGDPTGQRVPLTFRNVEEFVDFQTELQAVLRAHGITDATIQQLGSATTGWRGNPNKPIAPWKPTSDVDFAIFSEQALAQAHAHGVPVNKKITQGGRFTVLKNEVPGDGKGFYDTPLGQDLAKLARTWNMRVYGDENAEGFDFKMNLSTKPFSRAVTVARPDGNASSSTETNQ